MTQTESIAAALLLLKKMGIDPSDPTLRLEPS